MSVASKARKKAREQVKRLEKVKNPKPAQLARLAREKETIRTANIAISAGKETEGKSLEELRAMRDESMDARGLLSGQARFDEALQARAYADAMRDITGRQKGQGTPYTGPGATVVQDDEGNIVRDATGRVQYEIDPEAYARRFIPQFRPTEEQLGMDLNIQEGLLTPWQQTNFQWLLGQEGLDPSAEGRIPGAFRQDWREEQWGDVYNEDTGRWTRAEDPQVRANAVAEQLRRYNAGEFNPTVGSVAGDRWTGPGIGVPSADQWLPPGWTPPGGGGGAYTRPAPKDWSSLRYTYAGSPESELGQVTQTPASRAMFGKQGRALQPWTGGQGVPAGLLNYQAPRGVGFDVTYSGGNPNLFDFNQDTTTTTNDNGTTTVTAPGEPAGWSHPDYATFMDYTKAMHALNQATHDPASASFIDWDQ